MANQYFFRDANDNVRIPVADGQYFTGAMSADYLRGNCFLAFYDANGDLVTPTGGTITFDSSAIEGQWLMAPSIQTINATDVIAGDALYTPPTFDAIVINTRMTLAGITGATHAEAFHWRE